MRTLFAAVLLMLLATLTLHAADEPKPNTLTPQEIADGWLLLFDGETTFGWKIEGEAKVENGALILGKKTSATSNISFGSCLLKYDALEINSKTWEANEEKVSGEIQFAGAFAKRRSACRNIKLRPLGLKPIFNGKDLTGWKEAPNKKSKFTVPDNNELNIKDGPGDLQTEEQWDDFILQLECISHGKHLNSGVFFRCIPGQYQNGYEAQIQNGYKDNDRTKPIDFGTGAIYRRVPARKVVSNDNEWFTMTVIAQGTHIATWVNGYQTVDWTDDRPPDDNPRKGSKTGKGPISLQGHDPTTNLSFRNFRIADLPKAEKK